MANTTFLALTNKLLRRLNEVEIAQADFASVRGVQALAKDAINAAIMTINNQHFEWPFNATSGSQVLTIGQEQYPFTATLKSVDWNSFHIQKDDVLNVNGSHLKMISKDQWENFTKDRDLDVGTDGRDIPLFVFKGQNFGFGVTPSPLQEYTVTFDYFLLVVPLDLYSDTPTVPANYDEVIMQGAIYHFYMFKDNDTQAAEADRRFKRELASMINLLGNPDDTMQSTLISHNTWAPYSNVYVGGSGD